MSWWASIDFHELVVGLGQIVLLLALPFAALGVFSIPLDMRDMLSKMISRKGDAKAKVVESTSVPIHDADGGKPGEQSVIGK